MWLPEYRLALAVWTALAPVAFVVLMLGVQAPNYGRFFSNQPREWFAPRSDVAWLIMESPNLVGAVMCLYWCAARAENTHGRPVRAESYVLVALFVVHYVNRALIYPLRMKNGQKRTSGFVTCISCVFCCCNSFFVLSGILKYDAARVPAASSVPFCGGLALWCIGFLGNIHADHVLRTLRQHANDAAYRIPYGGMYRFVSCPNYLFEIIEWSGFALAAWRVQAAWAFALWTTANLLPRAHRVHQWYMSEFDSAYAALNRRACVPFIF
ncbi:3-oxo-5-alpha-steroid 4-dehydrogenase 1 [Porphyridium purpureum]|uniref:3-oxo-5-alpha-steroid 4-dehydrogenase 1 n=1 Tax=Porphyridium purpureum TaxID=35688 RepID=A0A5J4YX78_PORPP|nr:3-oxo-5-alpha-steroid 4-dehydrogenase 1 [Porphyridium purpureum]|eukprot:POR0123..scf209_3